MGALRAQRGDALVEAMVGAVVASVLSLGVAYTATRTILSERIAATQNSTLDQMVAGISTQGMLKVCQGTAAVTVQLAATTTTLPTPNCTGTTDSVTFTTTTGLTETFQPDVYTTMTLSTPTPSGTASSPLGGDGVMAIVVE
jgi:prepilin peptidase dependent protein A